MPWEEHSQQREQQSYPQRRECCQLLFQTGVFGYVLGLNVLDEILLNFCLHLDNTHLKCSRCTMDQLHGV